MAAHSCLKPLRRLLSNLNRSFRNGENTLLLLEHLCLFTVSNNRKKVTKFVSSQRKVCSKWKLGAIFLGNLKINYINQDKTKTFKSKFSYKNLRCNTKG